MTDGIEIEDRGPVRFIFLNRPDRMNAISIPMFDALHDAFVDASSAPQVRAVVVAGRGRAFSAGADVADFAQLASPEARAKHYDRVEGLLHAVAGGDLPVIAAVHGPVYGAAFELVLACDACVAATGTRFAWKEAAVGLIPSVGLVWGRERLGPSWTRLLAYTGADLDETEGYARGLVQAVVDTPAAAMDTAFGWAGAIAAGSQHAVTAVRRLTHAGEGAPWPGIRAASLEAFESPDHHDRVARFLDRSRADD